VTLFIPFVGLRLAAGTAVELSSPGLDGADGIVDFFPVAQLPIEVFHFQRAGRDLVELLGVGIREYNMLKVIDR
jgi:hypothetical protein